MNPVDPGQQDSNTELTQGNPIEKRRPGELAFALVLSISSAGLLWTAYGIENPFGPNGLSSPRAIPVATTFVMLATALTIATQTIKKRLDKSESIRTAILPRSVIIFIALLMGYGMLLKPLGFLCTSALFLIIAIKLLASRSWLWTFTVSILCLLMVWLIFRIVFSVLLPPGIVPEAELIQWFRSLRGTAS